MGCTQDGLAPGVSFLAGFCFIPVPVEYESADTIPTLYVLHASGFGEKTWNHQNDDLKCSFGFHLNTGYIGPCLRLGSNPTEVKNG